MSEAPQSGPVIPQPNGLGLKGRLAFLAKDASVYGVGGAVHKAFALITFPLLARHFPVEQYGILDLLHFAVALLVMTLAFGQDSAVARYFYEREDFDYRRQVISQSLVFQMAICAIVLPVIWFNAGWIARSLSLGENGALLIQLITLQAPLTLISQFTQGLLKWTFRKWAFLTVSIGSAAVTLLCFVIAIAFFELTLVSVFGIYLVIRGLACLIGLWFIRKWLTRPNGIDRLKELIPFAIPLGVICVIAAFQPLFERNLVQTIMGPVELGLFAAGAKIGLLVMLPITAFEMSWGPFSLSLHKDEDASSTFSTVLKLFTLILLMIVLGLAAFGEFAVILLASAKYSGAGVVVFALAMAPAVTVIGSVLAVGITFSKRSHLFLYGYLGLLVTAVITIPLLGHAFGLAGIAWGSLLAYFTKSGVEAVLAQRVHPLNWQYRGPVLLIALVTAIGLAHTLFFDITTFGGVSAIPAIAGLVLPVIAWFLLFSASERAYVTTMLKPLAQKFVR